MVDMPIGEVLKHLPHRYPFLLVDRVLECIPGKSLVALKNVDDQRGPSSRATFRAVR